MMENNELVVDEQQAKELGCSLDEITVGDAAAMHSATGMWFEVNNGHITRIFD